MNLIKESFDNLPMAVAYFDELGLVKLANKKMLQLSVDLLGSEVQHIDELKKALSDFVNVDDKTNIFLIKGNYLRFKFFDLRDYCGKNYIELTVNEVNDLMQVQKKLQEENKRLEQANIQAGKLCENMSEIVRQEEILTMKIRVHDDLGHTIISARNMLRQAESLQDIKANVESWEKIIGMLYNNNSKNDLSEPIEFARKRARSLGVELIVDGDYPHDDKTRYVYSRVIRECTNNCLKHAGGNKLFIKLDENEQNYYLKIGNNGKEPLGEIVEGGGLTNLRKIVENEKGIMTIESSPCFVLQVMLPKRKENEYVQGNDCRRSKDDS
ncbi:MAG: hypothetical protein Q4C64_07805 [Erysipelotrichia bacterium]|nr:hypothetical protein [Erysipelotrichia bacterium]